MARAGDRERDSVLTVMKLQALDMTNSWERSIGDRKYSISFFFTRMFVLLSCREAIFMYIHDR